MGARGPKPKPRLQVVREGNPGKRRVRNDVQLPPGTLTEPKWSDLLPGTGAEIVRARRVASDVWERVYQRLHGAGFVSDIDAEALADLGVVRAMIWLETRRWSPGDPITTLDRLHARFVTLSSRFYLTPGDRANVDLGEGAKDDDQDFDRPVSDSKGRTRRT